MESVRATAFTVSTAMGEISVRMTDGAEGPAAPAVLCLHANPGDSRDFDAVVPALAQGRTVVTMDWPGFGQSPAVDPDQMTADRMVNVAEQLIQALAERGVRRLVLVGNSVGGYVAVRLAQRRPDAIAGLVLVDPAGFTRHNALTRAFCRQVMGRPSLARHIVAPLARAYLGRLRTSSARATYARARRVRHDPIRLAVHCAIWRSFADPGFDLTEAGSELSVPTLLIWGRRDPVLPALLDGRRARRSLPHARYVSLPTGHEPFNEHPPLFLGHVTRFLREDVAR
ncbi:alpha/beta hydrolase [Streptomyces sp. NPDC023998]|uniref:alpha/beta fold hydrolase n=1 Tax=Streptomyces sp. NPDC023998 TaxID=3154597 RepID=UPI0033DA7B48